MKAGEGAPGAEAEAGEQLAEPVERGSHSIQFVSTVFDLIEEKEYSFSFDWDGEQSFTFSVDEMWFDSAFHGWAHWEDESLLVAYHQFGNVPMGSATVAGVPEETELQPDRAKWWLLMAELVMRAIWVGSDE